MQNETNATVAMTLDFARTLLVPIATASRIKSTRLRHRSKLRNVISGLQSYPELGTTQPASLGDITTNDRIMDGYRVISNTIYDSDSNTTDTETTRTGYDEDKSVVSSMSMSVPHIHTSSSLASSGKSSKGLRRPGYKMMARTGIPKQTVACKLRHTKIMRTRTDLAAGLVPHSVSKPLKPKSSKLMVSGKEKLTGKCQRTAGDSNSAGVDNKGQATKKFALKYGGKHECPGRFKRPLKASRSVNTKVSQTKIPRPKSESLLVQGEKFLAENNSTNASDTKGNFLNVKMRPGEEKEVNSKIGCTFLTQDSRLQFDDPSSEPHALFEDSPIPIERLETPDEKQKPCDHLQKTPEQLRETVEQTLAHIEQQWASEAEPHNFQENQDPNGEKIRSASMASSRVKTSLTKTTPVLVCFPPLSTETDKASSHNEIKAALSTASRTSCKPPTQHDSVVKYSKIKRRPSLVPTTTAKISLKKAASGSKIAAEKTNLQKPRKVLTGPPVRRTGLLREKLGTASSSKKLSFPNCSRPKGCARYPATNVVKRDPSLIREVAVTRSLKSKLEVKIVASSSCKPKHRPEKDQNANAGSGAISRNASPREKTGAVRYRRDIFVSDEKDVNRNADDSDAAGVTRSSLRLSKHDSREMDVLNLESLKPRNDSNDAEGDSDPLVPANEPETAENEDTEAESAVGEKLGSTQAMKGMINSLSNQFKHVNIKEVKSASPRVVKKKRKKVVRSRTDEVKEAEPGRCPLFQGWDFGTTLEKHTMDHVPVETDITQLLIARTTRTLWTKAGSSFKTDLLAPLQYPSAIHAEKSDVKKYLAEHVISEHFQRITNTVLDVPKSEDLLQMMINQGKVLSPQAVYQKEAERLLSKMVNKSYTNPISFPSVLKTEALRQAELPESVPTAEQSVDEPTEDRSEEQPAITVDESATLTGKTSGSSNVTNERQ